MRSISHHYLLIASGMDTHTQTHSNVPHRINFKKPTVSLPAASTCLVINKRGVRALSSGIPLKQVPAKVRVIAFYSLDTITEVSGEPLNFSTAITQMMKMLQQQGMIKRIECLSHTCIQKCNRGNLSSTHDSLVNNSKPKHSTFSSA